MKKIHYIVTFILVLIIVLLFFLWPKYIDNKTLPVPLIKKTADIPVSATTTKRVPQTKEIIYTNEGFSPSVLSVFAGDTVIFKNKSDEDFQPTSNARDKNGEYPDFTSANPVPKNKPYEFTFKTPGEYGYYDALNQSRFGVVVVK
ncbi:MAG: cupredoxin domain-containing protein [Candidatus Paceibacterota bacterium]|jgi:plastocyanin